jgi:hypothetical protein
MTNLVMNSVIFFLFLSFIGSFCEVYLRPRNDRGPGTYYVHDLTLQKMFTSSNNYFEGAAKSAVACIEKLERIFFKNNLSQQVQNIGVFHSKNLSSPSSEIEYFYLNELHERILKQEIGEESFQLKVISDTKIKQLATISTFSDIALTDCYVIIGDSMKNVCK